MPHHSDIFRSLSAGKNDAMAHSFRQDLRKVFKSLESRQSLAADLLLADSFEGSGDSNNWAGIWFADSQNDWFDSSQRATHSGLSAEVDGYAAMRFVGRLKAMLNWRWIRALVNSAVATMLCVVIVGIFFVPDEISRLKTKHSVRADFSRVLSDGRAVITIAGVKASKDWSHQLLLHDLSHNPSDVWSLLPDRNPICAALDSVNHRLFVGDASGALLVTSQQRSAYGSSRVLGHGLQGWCQSIACSPDGKLLVAHDMVAVYAWDVDARYPRSFPLWCRVDPSIRCFAITPDSRSVIFSKNSSRYSNLLELDVQTGETRTSLASLDQKVERLVMSADGKFMACLGIAGEMTLLQWHSASHSWKPRMISGLCSGKTRIASFSESCELLVTTDHANHRLVAWDLERGVIRRRYDKQSSELLGCEFFDSDQLLSWSSDGKLQIWNLRDAAPVREIQL